MNKCPKIVLLALMSFMFFNFSSADAVVEGECIDEVPANSVVLIPNYAWLPKFFICGTYNSGNRNTPGYYAYPAQTLNVSCYSNGATVYLSVFALDVPNRFTIKKDGSYVTSSIWLGCASYSGPWGPSVCNSSSASLSFTKSSGSYTIHVETSVQDYYDYWEAY